MEHSHQPAPAIARTPNMAARSTDHHPARFGTPSWRQPCLWLLITAALLCAVPARCESVQRDLSDAEETGIIAGSAAILVLGRVINSHHAEPVFGNGYHPNALDTWMRRMIHGGIDTTTNFLDNHFGSALTPAMGVAALSLVDINRDEFGRDIPFFLAGLAATKGLTDLTKHLVGRPRPYCIDGGCPPPQLGKDDPFHQGSFFSGHASAAFFSAAFFNKRFRRHMRQNWTKDEYRTGRVLSPLVSFGWASFVGFSRIQADRHFFTDVAAGALAGALIGELYYFLAYESDDSIAGSGPVPRRAPMLLLSFPVN